VQQSPVRLDERQESERCSRATPNSVPPSLRSTHLPLNCCARNWSVDQDAQSTRSLSARSSPVYFDVSLSSTAEQPHHLSAAAARVAQLRNLEASPFRLLAHGMMERSELLEAVMEQEPLVWVRVDSHEPKPVAQSLIFSLLRLTAP